MNYFIKVFIMAICLVNVLSCTQKGPYEVKSPCVSIDSLTDDNSYSITPCVRRPANLNRDLV